ncbi:putative carboxypeptidase S1 [Xylariales sp. AK1849]|nr:putative carboxypeptidase S1 [Xylariales sp. AK1849]
MASADILKSRLTEGVEITYKEPGICETTPGVKSYSGYLTLSSTPLQPYVQKTFFWFFESRNAPEDAPVAIWLQGGPGTASIDQALGENGPCTVQTDSNSTVLNPWSWNNYANILYLDQPVQVGFSYDVATPGVLNTVTGDIIPGEWTGPLNYTAVKGPFASQNSSTLVNNTAVAAEAVWEFLQAWMGGFPQYKRDSVSVWSQSYGGHYAPAVANLLQTRSADPAKKGKRDALAVSVDSVGIINGLIDLLVQAEYFPLFAINNTYGIQAYDTAIAESASTNYTMAGGCREQLQACRELTPNGYRDQYGTNDTITEACGTAFCRDPFDVGHFVPDPFPHSYPYGFLARDWVLEALGAEVNYTQQSNLVGAGFQSDGDFAAGGFTEDIASLLDAGVRVALINGDRDFRCNWVGGEAISLTINHKEKAAFSAAGYAEIATNASYTGGMVRQQGNFSFLAFAAYQPETAHQLFTRTIFGKDVATGALCLQDTPDYASEGPASVFNITTEPPTQPASWCYVLSFPLQTTCSEVQIQALLDGTAVVENYIVLSPAGDISRR